MSAPAEDHAPADDVPAEDDAPAPAGRRRTTAWVAQGFGAAIVAWAAWHWIEVMGRFLSSGVRWLVASALVADLVIVPAAAATGALGRRVLPARAWPPVRAALLASAALAAYALPLVLGLGGKRSNPSLRPRPYGSGLAVALTVVWVVAGAWLVVGALVRRRRGGGGGAARSGPADQESGIPSADVAG